VDVAGAVRYKILGGIPKPDTQRRTWRGRPGRQNDPGQERIIGVKFNGHYEVPAVAGVRKRCSHLDLNIEELILHHVLRGGDYRKVHLLQVREIARIERRIDSNQKTWRTSIINQFNHLTFNLWGLRCKLLFHRIADMGKCLLDYLADTFDRQADSLADLAKGSSFAVGGH